MSRSTARWYTLDRLTQFVHYTNHNSLATPFIFLLLCGNWDQFEVTNFAQVCGNPSKHEDRGNQRRFRCGGWNRAGAGSNAFRVQGHQSALSIVLKSTTTCLQACIVDEGTRRVLVRGKSLMWANNASHTTQNWWCSGKIKCNGLPFSLCVLIQLPTTCMPVAFPILHLSFCIFHPFRMLRSEHYWSRGFQSTKGYPNWCKDNSTGQPLVRISSFIQKSSKSRGSENNWSKIWFFARGIAARRGLSAIATVLFWVCISVDGWFCYWKGEPTIHTLFDYGKVTGCQNQRLVFSWSCKFWLGGSLSERWVSESVGGLQRSVSESEAFW